MHKASSVQFSEWLIFSMRFISSKFQSSRVKLYCYRWLACFTQISDHAKPRSEIKEKKSKIKADEKAWHCFENQL